MSEQAVIAGYARTPFHFAGKGELATVRPDDMAAEAVRAEGASPWYTAPHDEFAIVMDGEIEFTFFQLTEGEKPSHKAGAGRLAADPKGRRMGRVVARRGHEVLLPKGAAYQLKAAKPSVALIQTSAGPESVEKWSDICVLK